MNGRTPQHPCSKVDIKESSILLPAISLRSFFEIPNSRRCGKIGVYCLIGVRTYLRSWDKISHILSGNQHLFIYFCSIDSKNNYQILPIILGFRNNATRSGQHGCQANQRTQESTLGLFWNNTHTTIRRCYKKHTFHNLLFINRM